MLRTVGRSCSADLNVQCDLGMQPSEVVSNVIDQGRSGSTADAGAGSLKAGSVSSSCRFTGFKLTALTDSNGFEIVQSPIDSCG